MKTETKTETKDAKAVLMTPEEVGLIDRAKDLQQTAHDAVIKVGEKYVELCKWIRQKQIAPKLVTEHLLALGFAKSRVSEVNRIAQCADELWNEYEAGKIGRNRILEIARKAGETEDLTEVPTIDDEREQGEGAEAPAFVESADEVKKRKIATAQKCAKTILTIAEFLNLRSRTFDCGNGWELKLSKSKKKPAKENEKPTAPMQERNEA